jgi:hypothetical protein
MNPLSHKFKDQEIEKEYAKSYWKSSKYFAFLYTLQNLVVVVIFLSF